MKKTIYAITLLALACGCRQEELNPFEESARGSLHARIENIASKTTLSKDNYVFWEASDMVAVFDCSTINTPYKVVKGTEGDDSCDLESAGASEGFIGGTELEHKVAYYPYSKDLGCACEKAGTYTISGVGIGEGQTYSPESFPSGSFPMVAVGSDNNLQFRNACGAIMLQVKGEATVKTVTIKGNISEKLCGEAVIIARPDGTPEVEMGSNASTSVTLDCGTGVTLRADSATEFMIVIPPTVFKSGFTATLTDSEGKEHILKTTKKNEVLRSSILVMPETDLSGNNDSDSPVIIEHEGLQYVWDESVIPEITINVSVDEWNRLLGLYDQNSNTKEYIKCNVTYTKGSETTEIIDAGIRLRGNTSRRRPETSQTHSKDNADWQHCHFGVNLRKFNKDNDDIKVKDIKGIRKFNLKWFKDDACYVRELFCYDLFRRAGIWTAAHDVYCRLWIHVEGDSKPAYYGVYEMIEPYDNKYVEKREHLFGSADGNLWKCSYDSHGPADLSNPDANMAEDNDRDDFTYELKETEGTFEDAKAQLQDFIRKVNGKTGDSFYTWIKEVCDVELLMKTYAVNVAVGMWDDLWNNGNNYYLYFNSLDLYDYKVFLIPYDYDNTLGTCNCYDPAKQDPYNWGDRGVLIEKLMQFEEFKNIYRDELKRLVDPANGLMDATSAMSRINEWQSKIQDYIRNDTGEDMEIRDEPAGWGSWGNYNLMTLDNNYFTEKAKTINDLQ